MRRRPRLALLLVLLLPLAAAVADEGRLERQREAWRSANQALARGETRVLERASAELRAYPLYPYLELAALRRGLAASQRAQVDDFLGRYAGQLPAARLREAWLDALYSERRWSEAIEYYRDDLADNTRRCRHAWALQQSGDTKAADAVLAALWPSPRSLPAQCDPVLAAWYARGHPGSALAWQRFTLAMNDGQGGIANYVMRYMDAAHRADAELFANVRDNPALLREARRFAAGNSRHSAIVEFGLGRLARSSATLAGRLFSDYARTGVLNTGSMRNVAPRIASNLASSSGAEALEWILGLPAEARSDALAEDAVRYALRGAGWSPVLAALAILPPALATEQRWVYWNTRAREAESGGQVTAAARESYAEVRKTRSWYGFLAADRIGEPYEMQHVPLPVSEAELEAVARVPGMARAREFELIGDAAQSRREWQFTTLAMTPAERLAAAKLADRWGWHLQAISVLATVKEWNDLELRFPQLYRQQFANAAGRERLDQAWLFAIARQESVLKPDARSPAGALGLMQVMPATAQLTARRAGIPYRGSSDLLDPSKNVVIGSRYMRMMLDDFGQNRILAAAAYNAGPARVRQWLKRVPGSVDHDRFVETIPFLETRKYVQNVLEYAVIYAYLQGRSAALVHPGERVITNPYQTRTASADPHDA